MWLTHFWHSWSQFFIFAWDVTAGGILRTGVLICLVGSDNGLAPIWCQAITWTNDDSSIGPLGTQFSEIWIKVWRFSFNKIHLKMLSAEWQPFCSIWNVLMICHWSAWLCESYWVAAGIHYSRCHLLTSCMTSGKRPLVNHGILFNILRLKKNGWHPTDNILKWCCLCWLALWQLMTWCCTIDEIFLLLLLLLLLLFL